MMIPDDLIGKKFGRWTVIAKSSIKQQRHICWVCKCDCGTIKIKSGAALKAKQSLSCGCLTREINSKKKYENKNERIYSIWNGIKERCRNKDNPNYGGRGIKICSEWESNYMEFERWALNNGYAENLTIDRIDNDGDYCPENCRWATYEEQANNKRNNVFIPYKGKIQTISQWSKEYNLPPHIVSSRIKLGWDLDDTFHTPVKDLPFDDLRGRRFNMITVLDFAEGYKHKNNRCKYYKCLCDCGNIFYAKGSNIKKGRTKSCGCYRKIAITERNKMRAKNYDSKSS